MITEDRHVSDIVRENPGLARVFEEAGINYCCGGRKPLSVACRERGLDPSTLVTALNSLSGSPAGGFGADFDAADENPDALSSRDLVAHIVEEHHGYLRRELPRLEYLTRKVAADHGDQDPRFREIALLFGTLVVDLVAHQEAEEAEVFPALVESGGTEAVAGALASLVEEHAAVAEALTRLRELTDGYTPADWACNTTRAMIHGLGELEAELHRHIHEENNVLFPRYQRLA